MGSGWLGASKANSFRPKIKEKLPFVSDSDPNFAMNREICILFSTGGKSHLGATMAPDTFDGDAIILRSIVRPLNECGI